MEERSSIAARGLSLTDEDRACLTGLYNGRLAEHGVDVRTVGWGSTADQAMRFKVLCRGLDLAGRRVLDVGCGLGDFVPWAEREFGDNFDYVGLDLASDLVASAQSRFGGSRREFFAGTLDDGALTPDVDVVIMSGTLTFRTSDNQKTMQAMLAAAFARSREAVCVNFMTSYADYQAPKNFHFSPESVFGFARSLTPYVTLHHDYPLYEFTVQLFRQPTLQRSPKS